MLLRHTTKPHTKPHQDGPHPLGLYIHIPFCKSKCLYCDFYSLPQAEERMDAYGEALSRHLRELAPRCRGNLVDTVYFGGGTPSYFGAERLSALLKLIKRLFTLAPGAEITLEANPDSAQDWKALRKLRRSGFNRISLGLQSADDGELRAIGRIHTFEQGAAAVAAARRAKLKNLSLDLIYGLPGQSLASWKQTLEKAVALEPEHLSCYALTPEEGTPLWEKKDALSLPDDDAQADMYLHAVAYLQEHGYRQYEISNFAKPGFESRHNLKYWLLGEYLGVGPGAHSDMGGVRYAYIRDLDAFIQGVEQGGELLSENEPLSIQGRDMEYLMLGLRTVHGVSKEEFENRYRLPFAIVEKVLERFRDTGHAVLEEGRWRLTPEGFLISNRIIGAVLDALGEEKERREQAKARRDYRIQL